MTHRFQGIRDISFICAKSGVKHAVISPGSRNVPLIKSFLLQSEITCFSIIDERSAGYVALGIALQTDSPVALICTSGTAVLNYAPAIAEAYYQKIPLIVITADRPPEAINQNENQVINQREVFKNFIKASYSLPDEISSDNDLLNAGIIVTEALNLAVSAHQGPVHINIPLREPLYEPLPEPSADIINQSPESEKTFALSSEIINKWNNYSRKLIIIGSQKPNKKLSGILNELILRNDVAICAENISNYQHLDTIYALDSFFKSASTQPDAYKPDLVMTLGNQIVSKQLRIFLKDNKPAEHWHIAEHEENWDMFNAFTHMLIAKPEQFLKELLYKTTDNYSDFKNHYTSLAQQINEKQNAHLKNIKDFCDLKVFEHLLQKPDFKANIFFGNSSPVRYSQFFQPNPKQTYYSNRGVSGIDGCLSTACGHSMTTEEDVYIILGDVSFIYDSNALWNNHLKGNLKIIVINNGGGEIFRMINKKDSITDIEDFIVTPHQVNIENIAKTFNIKYLKADNAKELLISFDILRKKSEKPVLLEINTQHSNNADIYKNFIK